MTNTQDPIKPTEHAQKPNILKKMYNRLLGDKLAEKEQLYELEQAAKQEMFKDPEFRQKIKQKLMTDKLTDLNKPKKNFAEQFASEMKGMASQDKMDRLIGRDGARPEQIVQNGARRKGKIVPDSAKGEDMFTRALRREVGGRR